MRVLFEVVCVFIVFWNVSCELTTDEISSLLQVYEVNINASLTLSRTDKALLTKWTEEHRVQQVDLASRFRVQKIRHKEHYFKRAGVDKKWSQCIDLYSDEVSRSERLYHEEEAACLKSYTEDEKQKGHAVDQIEREIKKWRKSYKYLSHLCDIDNSGDEESAKACLVDYIERDNYNSTLQRLMLLKLEAVGQFYVQLQSAIENLDTCLKAVLSGYLDKVRSLVDSLNRCYRGNKKE